MPDTSFWEDDVQAAAPNKGGSFWDDDVAVKGGVTVASPPNAEELRAQRVRSASPKELRRIHFGENAAAGQRADQVSPVTDFAEGLGVEGPAGMVAGLKDLPSLVYKSIARPAQVGAEMLSGIGKQVEQLGSGTPRESGAAAFNLGSMAVPAAKAVTTLTAPARTAWKTYQGAQVGNRLKAGLGISPTDARALSAIDESLGTLRSGTKAKVPFTNSQSMADFVSGHNQKFYKTHHESLTQINQTLPVEFMGETTSLDKVIAERTRLNKRLHNYQSQDPKTRAIMEEVNPSLKSDVERLQASREAINGAIDTVAPQSASQADIMRTFSHLKELEDIATTRAAELKAIKQIAKGSKLPISEVAKDFVMNKVTLGMAPGAQIPSRVLLSLRNRLHGPRIDPDKLIRIAGRKFKHVQAAEPITPEPMEFPNEPLNGTPTGQAEMPFAPPGVGAMGAELPNQFDPLQSQIRVPNSLTQEFNQPLNQPPAGQGGLQFAPPGVGAMGSELPLEQGSPRAIQMPNELTRQFNLPLSAAEDINQPDLFGQTQMPFVAPQIGGVPQSVGGIQGSRGPSFPNTYGAPDPRADLLRNFGGQIRTGAPVQGQTALITMEPKPTPQIGQIPRPTISGKQLQPYTGPERRGPGATGHEQRLGYRAAQSAAADPAVAQRASQLHDAISGPGGTSADLDELARLQEQYDWIGDYLAYGRNPVQRGGLRK